LLNPVRLAVNPDEVSVQNCPCAIRQKEIKKTGSTFLVITETFNT
jgi:ferredoxin-thioredoxin reductase catalytic subunit